jgi:hypothetical protein
VHVHCVLATGLPWMLKDISNMLRTTLQTRICCVSSRHIRLLTYMHQSSAQTCSSGLVSNHQQLQRDLVTKQRLSVGATQVIPMSIHAASCTVCDAVHANTPTKGALGQIVSDKSHV